MQFPSQLKSGFKPAGTECLPWAVFTVLGGLNESTISGSLLSLTYFKNHREKMEETNVTLWG